MFVHLDDLEEEEPPISPAAALAGKASQLLLIGLCAGPIAVFAIGLAHRTFLYFFQ